MNQLFSNERRSKQKHCGIPRKESAQKVNSYTIGFPKKATFHRNKNRKNKDNTPDDILVSSDPVNVSCGPWH